MQITTPIDSTQPTPISWLATAIAYGVTFALIAGTLFFSIDETRALIG